MEAVVSELDSDFAVLFFVAHAVRARGSDGHQNVCGRSTILKL